MNTLVKKLLTHISPNRSLEYLAVDREFNIIEMSNEVERFADDPDRVKLGQDVRISFPELIGFEDILTDVMESRQNSFVLKGIGRFLDPNKPLYIDILIFGDKNIEEQERGQLILLIEDATNQMVLEQNLVQGYNETSLLASALSGAKQYLDCIINAMADALLVTNSSGYIKTVNQAAIDLFGFREKEFKNRSISTIASEEIVLEAIVQSRLAVDNELFKNLEVLCQTKNGKKIYVAFSCSAIQTEIEGVKDFVYVGRNITNRLRAEKRKAAQYAIAEILSESATLAIAAPKILPGLCQSLGWDVGELWTTDQKLGTATITPPETPIVPILRCVEMWVVRSLEIPEFINVTWQSTFEPGVGLPGRVWASGSPHWIVDVVDDANFPLASFASKAGLHGAFGFPIVENGEVLGVMTFFSREVLEPDEDLLQLMAAIGSQIGQFIKRKQAEAALQEREEQYRDLFENANDLIQSIDPSGRFLYVNRAWRETLGYSEAEAAKISIFDIIHAAHQAEFRQVFYRVMSGKKIDKIETAFVSKTGQKISVEGSINCKIVDKRPVATRGIFRDITKRLEAEEALRHQQEQTERLLLNILPAPIVERLKQNPSTIADYFEEVTVLFADIVGFTELSAQISPSELVGILNVIFSKFDQLAERHGLEKIKTIGDAYMVVGGIPVGMADHGGAIAEMALDMLATIAKFNGFKGQSFNIRIGINTGPVTAGVIGIKKFSYDLWGDTVNTASRMESQGLPGEIQVTEATYQLLRDRYLFEERGAIAVKGKGNMTAYLLKGRKGAGERVSW